MYRVTVEPILFFGMLSVVMYSVISQEYVYNSLANSYGLHDHNLDPCNATSVSPATKALSAKVSAASSKWTLYLNIAGCLPSLVITIISGSWGDVVGRKPPLCVSIFGLLVLVIIYMLTMHFQLPLYVLLFGRIFSGLCGDYTAVLGSCFAYLSDTSTRRTRTLRVAIGEVSISIGGVTGSLISGVWADAQGYVTPLWLLVAGLCSCMLYTVFLLPESNLPEVDSVIWKLRKLCSPEPFVGLWNVLRIETLRTKYIFGILFCFFLEICIFDGIGTSLTTFQLSPPFCFSNTLVGYTVALFTGGFIFGILFLKLAKSRISEKWIVTIAVFSNILSMLMLIFARSIWIMFVGIGIGCLQGAATVIFRSLMSKLVESNEQGSVFSLIASSEAIAGLTSSFMFNGLYAATVATFPFSIMVLAISIDVVILVVFWFMYGKVSQHVLTKMDEQNSNLISDEDENVET